MEQDFIYKFRYLIAAILVALTVGLGYFVGQSDFYLMLPMYAAFFGIYIFIYKNVKDSAAVNFYIAVAILLRFILLFALPNLSDDVYRFIWDGRLMNAGFNPFDHLPNYFIEQQTDVVGITPELYALLNSPNYFTIYPPVCQGTFTLATWLFPNSIWGAAFVMKLFLFVCEVGSIFLLKNLLSNTTSDSKTRYLPKNMLIYALNPLIIIEICGNLHFEGAMIFFLLLAYYLLLKNKWAWSALAMALSIASKLLPLIFLPFLIRRLGWQKSVQYFAVVGIALVLMFVPLVSDVFIQNFGNSLDLYFRKFEFNASLYYLSRWIGFQYVGYNMIAKLGPMLALFTLLGVLLVAFFEKEKSLESLPLKMLFAITLYLLCTTTVHPWYVSLPLVLCCFGQFRFPMLWSGLIFLTYVNYSYEVYIENLWVVGLEYFLVVGFLGWEVIGWFRGEYPHNCV